jgi:hypothetical protein
MRVFGCKTLMRNESDRWDQISFDFCAPPADHDPLEKGLSVSIDVGTRKMVNYA